MADSVSITISGLALGISALNAWLTLWRRGGVKMTQPRVIFFGPDAPRSRNEPLLPKVYLRTLLFSTSKRGRVIESMHVALSRNETHQNLNIWDMEKRSLCAAAVYSLVKPAWQPIIIFSRRAITTLSNLGKAITASMYTPIY